MKTTSAFPVGFLAIVFASASLMAQSPANFIVIKVNGKVYSLLLKRELKTGDLIKNSDKLSFATKESYLRIINASDGQREVRNIPDNSPRELMQLLDKFLDQKNQGSKSRGASTAYIDRLTEQLSKERLVILGEGRIRVDTSRMKLRSPSGIRAMYEIDGKRFDKPVSDQVTFGLGKGQLFGSMEIAAYPKVQLYYYEDQNDPAFTPFVLVGFFTPVYPDEKFLIEEINAIVNAFRSDSGNKSIIFQEIFTYIVSEYGDPVEVNLREWLETMKLLN